MKSALKKLAVSVIVLVIVGLLLLGLALPRILKSQAEAFVSAKTGHRLVMALPKFDPFELALHLSQLRLTDPQEHTLLAFDDVWIDLSAASLTRRALVFDAIRLEGLAASVEELPGGKLNWTPFLDALLAGEEKPQEEKGLPRLEIRNLVLTRSHIDYADHRRSAEGFATRIEPLELELAELSTLPDREGRFRLTARTALGARIGIAGRLDLDPLRVSGHLDLAELQVAKLGPYLKQALPVPPEGVLALAADFEAGNDGQRFDARIAGIQARLTGLRVTLPAAVGSVAEIEAVELKDGRFQLADQQLNVATLHVANGRLTLPGIEPAPHFTALAVEDIRMALGERNASIGRVALDGGRIRLQRDAQGRLDLVEGLRALAASDAEKAYRPAAETQPQDTPAWRYQVGRIEVNDLGVRFADRGVDPPFEIALERIGAQVSGLSQNMDAPLPVQLTFDVASGGHGEAQGSVVPATAASDIAFRVADLSLKPLQPFLASKTTLTLSDGRLNVQGRARYDGKQPHVKGEFAVQDLRLLEPGSPQPLMAWKKLASRRFVFTPGRLDLGDLTLAGLDTRLLIDKDKNVNIKRVLKAGTSETAVSEAKKTPEGAAPPAQSAHATAPPAFVVNIDRLHLRGGEIDFADASLVFPFATRIHDLHGSIAGLSNRPDAVGVIELEGAVDDYGLARAAGQVELGNPTNGLEMRVQFRNIEMTRLTPYMATFAGRKIDSGKLSLDLEYRIRQRQLTGDNQVIMDRLTLGERVESPRAKDLPLDLAIALLQDADGRIDLGLPVSGSLDDPQFSYGGLIWKAITNVITKIVTAPFRTLAALFGGGEALEEIVFEPGAVRLTPPEREKAVKLATALGKRPKLALIVTGLYADADRRALQEARLRRSVLLRAGQSVPESGDPGPLATQQPKIRAALEALFKERFGAADLEAMKEGFRKANPGQLEEGAASKLVSRLASLWRGKKTLSEDEVARLKGVDFYGVLFERLRLREEVPDSRLQALAEQRANALRALLEEAGVAAERLELAAPEPARPEEVGERGILVRLIPQIAQAQP